MNQHFALTINRGLSYLGSAILTSFAATSLASAQITATTIIDDSSIINTGGTLVSAANFGEEAATVNGLFHGQNSTSGANLSFTPGFQGPFGSDLYSGDLARLFKGIAGANGITLDISNLEIGTEYLFQVYWDGGGGTSAQTLTVTMEGDTLNNIADQSSGTLISYTFTAGDDTLNAIFDRDDGITTGDQNNWLSGYSLQKTAVANPELVGTTPADDATEFLITANLTATFDVALQPGTGSISIYTSDDTLVEALDVNDITAPGTVTFAGTQVIVDPTAPLEEGVGYYVLIDSTAVTGLTSNPFDGISDTTDWNFMAKSLQGLSGELGVLDLSANNGVNPSTGSLWKAGDTYRFLFVTSQTTTAESDDIETYNTFVQDRANASSLNLADANWKIVGSTATIDALTNTSTNPSTDGFGEAILLLDSSTVLATNYADLWDGTAAKANLDENAQVVGITRAFTGTSTDGTSKAGNELGTTNAGGLAGSGDSNKFGTNWINDFNDSKTNSIPVYGLSAPLTITGGSIDPVITSFTSVGVDTWQLTLTGDTGTAYEFLSSSILDFDPGTLVGNLTPGVPAVGTIGGSSDQFITTDSSGDASVRMTLTGPKNFVIARIPPPLTVFNENFDTAAGPGLPTGWAQGRNDPPDDATSTTVWEIGTPSVVGPIPPGTPVPSGTQCVATDIASNYFITDPQGPGDPTTDIWLLTPPIDLSGKTAGTLAFQQWFEIEDVPGDLDYGSIRILDASDDSLLAVLEDQSIDGSSIGWEAYSMALPPEAFAAAAGTIKIEFRFEADDLDSFAGWYIDDVSVVVPGS